MAGKFKNKYRIETTRLQNWDYGSNGAYFVTICSKYRYHYFGGKMGGIMTLTEIGKMAEKYWFDIPQHFPFVKLGAFVVMPNHIHGIIVIDKSYDGRNTENAIGTIETQNFASLSQPAQTPTHSSPKNKFGPQSKNLASIVRGFKIGVTKNARLINPDFQWQPRFYDHIIRNENEYHRISQYIIDNPSKWNDDKPNPYEQKNI